MQPQRPLVTIIGHINNYLYELRKQGAGPYAAAVQSEVDAAVVALKNEFEAAKGTGDGRTEEPPAD